MRAWVIIAVVLAACSPTEIADKVGRRTAETVVRPVVADYLSGAQAETATQCIVNNASAEDIRALVEDVGVGAGTRTVANVKRIAATSAAGCMAAAGIAGLGG